jgi:CRISPR/Cas system-associated protein endoribonuclease Cas2
MTEETNIKEVIAEIKEADEETLKQTIEKWFESTRNQGLKLGAQMISIVVYETIKKHTKKAAKVSLNDYKRMTAEIINIISVQLTEQNDSEENTTEEIANDE